MRQLLLVAPIAAVLAVAGDAPGASFREDFSAVPRSYGGVSDCGDAGRQAAEAEKACREVAAFRYGNVPTVTFTASPSYAVSSKVEVVCGERYLGLCVSYKRECTGNLTRLDCHVEVDFHH